MKTHTKRCIECGKEFTTATIQKKVCSDKCTKERARKLNRENYQNRKYSGPKRRRIPEPKIKIVKRKIPSFEVGQAVRIELHSKSSNQNIIYTDATILKTYKNLHYVN